MNLNRRQFIIGGLTATIAAKFAALTNLGLRPKATAPIEDVVDDCFQPQHLYLALFTQNPDPNSGEGGKEASGCGYTRKPVQFSISNDGDICSDSMLSFTVGKDLKPGNYEGWGVYDDQNRLLLSDTFEGRMIRALVNGDCVLFGDNPVRIG